MGKHGVGTMNENGNLFVELCGNHSLKIGGTLFPENRSEMSMKDKAKSARRAKLAIYF
jgi:hypothetical protein